MVGYHAPGGVPLDYGQACYALFMLIFFEPQVDFPPPQDWGARIMFFVVPFIGLGFLAEGLVRFAVLVFNKQMRWEKWQTVLASTYSEHVILCGLGHVGYRVAQQLIKLDQDFVCITKETKFAEQLRKHDVPVLVGDARDEDMLVGANVARAKAIILATDDDLANLETAINARARNDKIRILVRMFDPELANKVESAFGIHMAFSTSQLAAPAIALAALEKSVLHSFYVGDKLMNVVELEAVSGCRHLGKTLEAFEKEFGLTVFVHRRGDHVDPHPSGDVLLERADHLILLTSVEILDRLEADGFAACAPSR